MASPERFLRDFHSQHPGVTRKAFAGAADAHGLSSYQRLAQSVHQEGLLLDLGCGDGYLLEHFVDHECHGIDLSPSEIKAAHQRGHVQTLVADARALPFPNQHFAVVTSHLAFMLMSGIETVVAELRRVLRPGGQFATVVGGGPKLEGAFETFLSLGFEILGARKIPKLGELRARSEDGLAKLFADGFHSLSIEDFYVSFAPENLFACLATVYDFWPLEPDEMALLQQRFEEKCGLNPECASLMRLVTLRRDD